MAEFVLVLFYVQFAFKQAELVILKHIHKYITPMKTFREQRNEVFILHASVKIKSKTPTWFNQLQDRIHYN